MYATTPCGDGIPMLEGDLMCRSVILPTGVKLIVNAPHSTYDIRMILVDSKNKLPLELLCQMKKMSITLE